MKEVFIVYKTDGHHSYASRDVIGIASSAVNAVALCEQQAKKEGDTISDEQSWYLHHIKQTQGYSGEGEFQFEEVKINVLL